MQFINKICFSASQAYKLLSKYRPEAKEEKKQRLQARAQARAEGKKEDITKRPPTLTFGVNNVVKAVEQRKVRYADDSCLFLIPHNCCYVH